MPGDSTTDPASSPAAAPLPAPLPAPPADPLPDPLVGTVVDGITLVRRIGEGGFGVVYEGRQAREPFVVAVKVMRPHVATPGLVRRFEYEAETLSRLDHPGIARFHRLAHTNVGGVRVPCIVMELVPAAKPITKHAGDLRLPVRARVELVLAAAEAIGHGHAHGILHRDVKPGNILVGADGKPKVIDYGWARGDDSAAVLQSAHTHVGQLIGTFQYMSPEQFDGDPAAVDIRSDVYALGAILHELLTGRPPIEYTGGPLFTFANRVRGEPPAPLPADDRDITRQLRSIVSRCLEKDKARRYSSATELAADLRRHLAGDPIAPVSPALFDALVYLARKHAAAATLAAVAVSALAVAAATSTLFYFRSEEARGRERDIATRLADESRRASAEAQRAVREASNARRQLAVANLYRIAAATASADRRRAATLLERTADLLAPGTNPWHDPLPVELACLRAGMDQSIMPFDHGDGRGPGADIGSVAVNDSGTRVATGAADGAVRLWDADTGALVATLAGDNAAPRGMARVLFPPGTPWLATAAGDGMVRLWESGQGTPVRSIDCGAVVRHLAADRDGRHLAAGTADGRVVVIPLDGGEPPRTIQAHSRGIRALALAGRDALLATVSPEGAARLFDLHHGSRLADLSAGGGTVAIVAAPLDGTWLAHARADGSIEILDATTRATVARLEGHDGRPRQVAASPDGRVVAVAGESDLAIWDLAGPRRIALLAGQRGRTQALAFSPDSSLLAVASSDRSVRLIRASDGAAIRTLLGHHDAVEALAWFPDGSRLVSGSADGVALAWPTSPAEGLATLHVGEGPVADVRFLSDGRLAVCPGSGVPRVWDVPTATEIWAGPRRGDRRDMAVSPDGSLVAVGGEDRRILLHDARDGSLRDVLEGHSERVLALDFARSGGWLASASDDGDIRLWQPGTATHGRVLAGHDRGVVAIAFSPDAALLASASRDASARLWRIGADTPPTILAGHEKTVRAVAWSSDGRLVATGSDDGTARVWRAADGAPVHTLRQGTSQLTALAFAPSGTRLVTGTMRGGCDLWDAESGAHLASLDGHSGEINAIRHSPDGTRVATCSSDHTARLWDASSGEPLLTLEGHDGPVTGLAFSADGRDLATSSADGTVRLWTRSDREIDRARRQMPSEADAADGPASTAIDTPE